MLRRSTVRHNLTAAGRPMAFMAMVTGVIFGPTAIFLMVQATLDAIKGLSGLYCLLACTSGEITTMLSTITLMQNVSAALLSLALLSWLFLRFDKTFYRFMILSHRSELVLTWTLRCSYTIGMITFAWGMLAVTVFA